VANDRLVWIDCEMTGLDLSADALVEVAVLVTDADLQVLGEGVDLVIRPPEPALAQMSEVVRSMHTSSGLLEALANGISLDEAREQILSYVTTYVPEAGKAPLAGNTVHMDRLFLARDLPEVEAHLHYRNVDVSSIKELARRWFPRVYFAAPVKTGNHRALGDIQDSIEELRYYRRTIFVPPPGPDTETARTVAREIVAARPEGSTDRLAEAVPPPPEAVAE
jgi:oligoribonuclease